MAQNCEKVIALRSGAKSCPASSKVCDVETVMVLTPTQLITFLGSCAAMLPGRTQVAIFEQSVHMITCRRETAPPGAITLYPLSRTRAVTDENTATLRKAFWKENGDGYIWLHSLGSIVVAITTKEAGVVVPDDYLERHAVWGTEGSGRPTYLYSFKKGK